MYPYKFLPVCCAVLCCEVMSFKVFGHQHTRDTNSKTIDVSNKAIVIIQIQVLLSIT